jgi:hypothetical protein
MEIPKGTHIIICPVGCENESNLHDSLTVNICLYEITGLGLASLLLK